MDRRVRARDVSFRNGVEVVRFAKESVANCDNFQPSEVPRGFQDNPFLTRTTCQNFTCLDMLHRRILKDFPHPADVHGAVNARVLIVGPEGNGKRQLATHVANHVAKTQNRTVLWVEGSTGFTVMRDLRFAFQLMTGKSLSPGVSVRWELSRIQRVLGECSSQWFMVVFDWKPTMQFPFTSSTAENDIATFFPRGHILITYANALHMLDEKSVLDYGLPPGHYLNGVNTIHHLAFNEPEQTVQYCRKAFDTTYVSSTLSQKALRMYSSHFVTTAISCATARMSDLSLEGFRQILNRKTKRILQGRIDPESPAALLARFSCAMQLSLEALRDLSEDAELLLITIVSASNMDIPVSLLEKIRCFRSGEFELEGAIENLHNASLIHVKTIANGDRHIEMHWSVFNWLRAKFRAKIADGNSVYSTQVRQWVRVLDNELPEIKQEIHKHKYWLFLHIAFSVLSSAHLLVIRNHHLVSLLRKVATFLRKYLIATRDADRLLLRAIQLTSDISTSCPDFDIELERYRLHRERSKLCGFLGDFLQARRELGHAYSRLEIIVGDLEVKEALQTELYDDGIELWFRQDNYQKAKPAILRALETRNLSPERRAKLHYWFVCCASKNDSRSMRVAILHSHMAMSYWKMLSEDERWGSKNFRIVLWVEAHCEVLLQLDRSRGALVFLPKLLEAYLEHCPPFHENIWRTAYLMVRENIKVMELYEAEKTAARVLSICDLDKLKDPALEWCVTMLYELGALFARTGRYIESEAIFRWCIVRVENLENEQSQHRMVFPALWVELCHILLVQGKSKEAEAARQLAIERGLTNLEGERWKENAMLPGENIRRIYDRVMQAALDRTQGIYNQDDELLNKVWPRDFGTAIRAFGDPFKRIKSGILEPGRDIIPNKEYTGDGSKILELLGYEFDTVASDTETTSTDSCFDENWETVFGQDIKCIGDPRQCRMTDFWRRCGCRRRRIRSASINLDDLLVGERIRHQEDAYAPQSIHGSHQRSILDYFTPPKKYFEAQCPVDCICVEANARWKAITEELESDRLFTYRSPDPVIHEAKQAAYYEALRTAAYRFGPRAPLPYGMIFYEKWQEPEGPFEPNGESTQQHLAMWMPDHTDYGDAESNHVLMGQDENYLLSNPAMTIGPDGSLNRTLDLPAIIITSHKLGEELRGPRDRFSSPAPKIWAQTRIDGYFGEAENDTTNAQTNSIDVCESSASPGLQKRIGRLMQRLPSPFSRAGSASSERERSIDELDEVKSDAEDSLDDNTILTPMKKLNIFNINSIHASGPVFAIAPFNKMALGKFHNQAISNISCEDIKDTASTKQEISSDEIIPEVPSEQHNIDDYTENHNISN